MTFKNASEKNIIEKRPNFLIIGAQKAGTTWLHRMLNQHPDIFFPEQKELHHFSNQDRAIFWGLKGYVEKYFASVKPKNALVKQPLTICGVLRQSPSGIAPLIKIAFICPNG